MASWLTGPVQAVATALDSLDILTDVTHEAWIGLDQYTKPVYAPPVTLRALVQVGSAITRTLGTEEIRPLACLTFYAPIYPNGVGGRTEPIDTRDRFSFRADGASYTGQPMASNSGSHSLEGGTDATRPVFSVWLK